MDNNQLIKSGIDNVISLGQKGAIYYKKRHFFSCNERKFYDLLIKLLNGRCTIFAKPRLIDIFEIDKKSVVHEWANAYVPTFYKLFNSGLKIYENFFTYRAKIIQKHVDFLLCSNIYYNPICGIELNGKEHDNKKERDNFVKTLFDNAELKFLVINNYELDDLRKLEEKLLLELSKFFHK